MKADFTRATFDKANQFTRVLMQQGRVTLDADYNEQVEILLHYMRSLARDLIGPYAAPFHDGGFMIGPDAEGKRILISGGRFYVDGILVENEETCSYTEQPHYSLPPGDGLADFLKTPNPDVAYWLYLDVWERHVTTIENDAIRELALGGPDTCTRTKLVWQIKALAVDMPRKSAPFYGGAVSPGLGYERYGAPEMTCEGPMERLPPSTARLAARVDPGKKVVDACVTSPDAKFRGLGNQLYRVEIHRGGNANEATFKWSRNNGSEVTRWLGRSENGLQVGNSRGFQAGNWVELSDEISDLQGEPGALVKLTKVEDAVLSFDPSTVPAGGIGEWAKLVKPKVRLWNQTQTEDIQLLEGAVPIRGQETAGGTDPDHAKWINLEDGIQIAFAADGDYRAGDYWLIPARVASGNIEWPAAKETGELSLQRPRGVEHHYAPLGFVGLDNGKLTRLKLCWCVFSPNVKCSGITKRGFGLPGLNPFQPSDSMQTFEVATPTESLPTIDTTRAEFIAAPAKRVRRPRKKKPA
ncbi:MAG TPA: DUF6519 domain-containing protein [Pyrinomonadaceae bacterium]|nr:DUF6519 domain-containing protein [Pyrinomonadaceae bacterium]